MTAGTLLREARTVAGLTQTELARRAYLGPEDTTAVGTDELAQRAGIDRVAAQLVARKAGAVHHQHPRPTARQPAS